ncbi:MAG TPA: N-acetylmuramoyl-L-alanine amidase [Candidatus Limnocylindria bacterium]|nr:N-acetylmuramoyl-L-alanine amidase [Candidatus Limnocylindria bacterium]
MGRARFFITVSRNNSAILFAVRKLLIAGMILLTAGASVVIARGEHRSILQQQAQPQQEQSTPQAGGSQAPGIQQPPPAQIVPPSAIHPGPIVILNPGHGGADTGARGPSGAIEKDVVLLFARIVRIELERQGYRVVMTRNDDSNPSYDDRAAVANSHRDALFISIHLASTGTVGAARVYYYQFPIAPALAGGANATPQPAPSSGGLLVWEEAQRAYEETSHHFADIFESDLAQHFGGSPATSAGFPVRELRSVAAPAVAVEISSVAVNDPNSLAALAEPLANSILRSIQAYRPAAAMGAK